MLKRIELILKTQNLTPSQLADRLGVQRSGMSHILSGRNKPSLDFVMKVLSAFPQINPNWLLFGEGKMYAEMTDVETAIHSSSEPLSDKVSRPGRDMLGADGSLFSDVYDENGDGDAGVPLNPMNSDGSLKPIGSTVSFDPAGASAILNSSGPAGALEASGSVGTLNPSDISEPFEGGKPFAVDADVSDAAVADAVDVTDEPDRPSYKVREAPTAPIPPNNIYLSKNQAKKVEKIVFFYTDGTFKDYLPAA